MQFIKRVVAANTNAQGELKDAITCALMCNINNNTADTDLLIETKKIRNGLMICRKGSPIDYAELYSSNLNGNSILFLRAYQDFFGPIE